MATTTNSSAATAEVRELVITRFFNAPRELVWKAWTEPERVMRWWGPKNFTAPFCRIDLRVGGKYLSCMRSAEGKDYWSTGVYREIAEPSYIVCTDSFADEKGNVVPASQYGMTGDWPDELLIKVMFEEHEGGTRLTLRHLGLPPGEMTEECRAGWNESLDKLAESLATPQNACMQAEPQREHLWLQKLVGNWTYEAEALMEPGKPSEKCAGSETVRSLGGLWILAEGEGEMPGGGAATMLLTLGYDPQKQRFVGTWIGSMMTHLWVYEGALDETGTTLTLNTEGPDMSAGGKMTAFRDVIEFEGDDHRTLTSHMLRADGEWLKIMTADYRRKG